VIHYFYINVQLLQLIYLICSVCVLCPTDSEVKSCMDIGEDSSVEIVNEFCCLGVLLSVDGDADAAVTARICTGWFQFGSLASFLTAKDIS